jgi:GDSL-like lipase/acylhydrolase family protein
MPPKIENLESIDNQEVTRRESSAMGATRTSSKGAKRQAWIGKILILIFSVLACTEGGSRLVLLINPLRRRVTGFDDASYRLQWIRLHREHKDWTGPFAIYHPTRGWALKSGIQDMKVFDGTELNTNTRGLRGKLEYNYERTPGKSRIVVLGDSFTFGAEVPDDATYSHYLESHIPNSEVLNFGVQGYGHDQMLMYLKDEGIKYHPDIVIVGFTYIDIYRNIQSFFAYAKPEFRLVSGNLQLTNVPVPTPARVLAEEPYRLKSFDMLFILKEKVRWALGKNDAEAREVTEQLLDQIVSTVRGIGAVPVFVYLPVNEEIAPLPQFGITTNSPAVAEREQYLRGICEKEKVPCLFLRPRFHAEVEKGVDLHPRGHWNAAAHSLAGEEIKNFLSKNRLTRGESSTLSSSRTSSTPNSFIELDDIEHVNKDNL